MTARSVAVRTSIAVVVAAASAAAVGGAVIAPWPEVVRAPVEVVAVPEAAASVIACDGPVLVLGRDQTQAGALTIAAEAAVVTGAGSGEVQPVEVRAPDRIDAGVFAGAYTAAPVEGRPAELAGATASSVDAEDLRGLAATACSAPAMESWLVAGAATTGAADLILLTNPGDVAATVDLRLYGAAGAQDPAGGAGIVVAPRTQRVIPLAAIAPGEESPVVRVTADGAPVRAALQSTLTRGLTPAGLDRVSGSAVPAPVQVIPSVDVAVGPDAVSSAGGLVVRMLAPEQAGTADVVVRSVDTGETAAEERGIALVADQPLALEMTGMPVGAYTVSVEADVPVAASAMTETDQTVPSDFAWAVAAEAFDAPTRVAVANAPAPMLTIVADEDASVTVSGEDGGIETVEVAAGATRSLAVEPGATYHLDPAGAAVRASVSFGAPGALAVYPVAGSAAAAAEVTVYP